MSGFLAVCVRLSLHMGRGWERVVKFCGRINKIEIVSKRFLCCSCLIFSRSFVHKLKGWEHNPFMSNFSPFFDVARICANFCM